jgi:outer membrane protein assembly factor BamB
VVGGGKIWLTTASVDGHRLSAVRIDTELGQIDREVQVFEIADPGPIHQKNSHASPTPILDGGRVYVHFGDNGTACLDGDGAILWTNQELTYAHGHGPGGSPELAGSALIINCDGTDQQYVAALDKESGRLLWKTPREGAMAYSTPLALRFQNQDQVVCPCGERVSAYDPRTGGLIWEVRYPGGYSNVPRPVFGQGLVYVSSGYNAPVLYAIRPSGRGDVTDTHVAWTLERGAPLNPSPLLVDELLYVVSDQGIATCLNAATGETIWQQRLDGAYSASPIHANGKLYFLNETGQTTVVAAGRRFRKLSENQVDGRTLASLAVSEGAIYLRTDQAVYRIEE